MSAVATTHPTYTPDGTTDNAGITHNVAAALLVVPKPRVNATLTQSRIHSPTSMTTWIVATVADEATSLPAHKLVGRDIYVKYPGAFEKNVVYFRGERAPLIAAFKPSLSADAATGYHFFGIVAQMTELDECGLVAVQVRLIGAASFCRDLPRTRHSEWERWYDFFGVHRGHWCMHGDGVALAASAWVA